MEADKRTQEIIKKEFEALKKDLIAAYDAKNMRASGRWAEALEVESEPNNTKLWGLSYSQQLESGRGRNSGKSGIEWRSPVQDIEQWIKDKGIVLSLEKNQTITSLAYAIVKKISKEGWNRNRFGGTELVSQVITPARIQSMLDKVSDIYVTDFTSAFIKQLKAA